MKTGGDGLRGSARSNRNAMTDARRFGVVDDTFTALILDARREYSIPSARASQNRRSVATSQM